MKALEILQSARELLEISGINDADRESELIVSHCLGIDRSDLYRENPDIPENILLQIYEYLREGQQESRFNISLDIRNSMD